MRRLDGARKGRKRALVALSSSLLFVRTGDAGAVPVRSLVRGAPLQPSASNRPEPSWLARLRAAARQVAIDGTARDSGRKAPALRSAAATKGATSADARRRQLLERLAARLANRPRAAVGPLPVPQGVPVDPCAMQPLNSTMLGVAELLDLAGDPTGQYLQQSRLTFGDLDGDGDLDLYVGIKYDGALLYLENVGTATAPRHIFATSQPMVGFIFDSEDEADPVNPDDTVYAAPAPELVDFDGDGDLDLLVGDVHGQLRLFVNGGPVGDSPASFTEALAAANPFAGVDVGYAADPDSGDLDGDGDYDLVVGSYDAGVVTLEQGPPQVFASITGTVEDPFPPGAFADKGLLTSPALGDLDGDGDLDLAVGVGDESYANFSFGTVRYFENQDSDGGALDGQPRPFVEQVEPESALSPGHPLINLAREAPGPELVDIDADGDLDAYFGGKLGSIGYYPNTGIATDPAFLDGGLGLTFVDIDDDGDLDAFTAGFGGKFLGLGSSRFYLNVGSAADPTYELQATSPLPATGLFTFADLDGDGDLDALATDSDSDGVVHFENTGTASAPSFVATAQYPELAGITFDVDVAWRPFLGDLDADGDADLVVGIEDGTVRTFLNGDFDDDSTINASAPFAEAVDAANPFAAVEVTEAAAPYLVDFDGDGDLDAFIGEGYGETVLYLENIGSPAAPAFSENDAANPLAGVFTTLFSTPAAADVNGDGLTDLFAAGLQATEWFLAQQAGVVVSPLAVTTSEAGLDAVFDVVLAGAPLSPVVLDVVSSDLTEGTVSPAQLTFTPANWNLPQSVTVTGVDDADLDGPIAYSVQLAVDAAASNDCFDGLAVDDVAALNLDDEGARPTKTITGGTLGAGGTVQYTVTLTNPGPNAQADNPGAELTDVLPPELELLGATATSGTVVADTLTDTVTWNGALAVGATVQIVIDAAIGSGAGGEVVSNQGTAALDQDGNGTNEASLPTDDPALPGAADATSFVAGAAPSVIEIPTVSGIGASLLAGLLGLLGAARLGRRRRPRD